MIKKQLTEHLEALALKNELFLKVQRTLLHLSTNIIHIEERGNFLKRCLSSRVLPNHEQLAKMRVDMMGSFNDTDLHKAYLKNDSHLTIEKENYVKAIDFTLGEVEQCFKEILLRIVSRKLSIEIKKIKRWYIQEFEK